MRRLSGCILGLAFGVGCAATLSPVLSSIIAPALMPAVQTASVSPEPVISAPKQAVSTPKQTASEPQQTAFEPKQAASEPKETTAQASPAPVSAPVEPQVIYPLQLSLKMEDGDTLINLLTDAGVSSDEAHAAVDAVRSVYDPRHLDIGQNIAVRLDNAGTGGADMPVITSLTIPVSATTTISLKRKAAAGKEGIFDISKIDSPVNTTLAHAGGPIKGSIYETAVADGIPAALVSEIINAYSYDVDFQRDIQPGDMLDVMYERMQTKDGLQAGHGNVLFAELNLGDRVLKIYRFTDKSGHADYYNEKGESVRKALLRTPINGAHITSRFGMRLHPVLGYTRMHRGIDFGAPIGTPIYAAGDGTVEFAGRKGGYGNFLLLEHNRIYSTAYGHISRFAKGIAPGRKVKQGQIIAYVGMTGIATGPHLHYEVRVNGVQVNPATVHFKTGTILSGRELVAFRAAKERIESQMASLMHTNLAMANTGSGASD